MPSDSPTPRLSKVSPLHGTSPRLDREAEDFSYTSFSTGKKLVSSALRKVRDSPKTIRRKLRILQRSKQIMETPPESPTSTGDQMDNFHTATAAKTGNTSTINCSNVLRVAISTDLPPPPSGRLINKGKKAFAGASSADNFCATVEFPDRFHSAKSGRTGSPGCSTSEIISPECEVDIVREFSIPERFKHSQQRHIPALGSVKLGAASPSLESINSHVQRFPPQSNASLTAHSPDLTHTTYTDGDDDDDDVFY